nr:hypothetical protein [Parachlamydiaceae bacterium]
VGHSLGGYLAGVIGAVHADEIYSFNGPGVDFEVDVKETFKNLNRERPIQKDVTYNSFSMDGDFIGNFATRSGTIRKFHIPILFKETLGSIPSCDYTDLLSHHGIKLMKNVINNSSVVSIPRSLSPKTTKKFLLSNLRSVASNAGLINNDKSDSEKKI